MTQSTPAPARAYRLNLALGADTAAEIANALRNLATRIECNEVTTGVCGGPSDGAIYELLTDPEMTHDAYRAALRGYLEKKVVKP